MKKFIVILLFALSLPSLSHGWDGYDEETGAEVEIERGNLVREGEEIEFYDYEAGEYRTGEVQDIERHGGMVEVEIYDYESDEYRTLEMEDD